MNLIGLNGRGRSGKDTVFKFIHDGLLNRTVYRDAFADRLKLSAAQALGVAQADLEAHKDTGSIEIELGPARYVISIRRYLERYGTEAHRDVFGQDFWINAVLEGHDPRDRGTMLVVTDLRFPNEAHAIRDLGGEVWEISRPGHELVSDHPSNQPLPYELVDRRIVNDGSLELLRQRIEVALAAALLPA